MARAPATSVCQVCGKALTYLRGYRRGIWVHGDGSTIELMVGLVDYAHFAWPAHYKLTPEEHMARLAKRGRDDAVVIWRKMLAKYRRARLKAGLIQSNVVP